MRLDKSISSFSANAELIIDLRPYEDKRLKYGPWAAGLQVSSWQGGAWVVEPFDPCISLLNPANNKLLDAPVHWFVAGIPAAVEQAAKAFQHLQTTLCRWRHAVRRRWICSSRIRCSYGCSPIPSGRSTGALRKQINYCAVGTSKSWSA